MTQTDREKPQFKCYNTTYSFKYGKTNSSLGFFKSIYLCTCFLLHQTAGNVVVSASKTCKPHTVQKVGKI